ncbi:MAG TPA: excinuclease ABC subunit A, partial [Lacipirellulaceae bacterium]|nr:excinuclease ABC subunit A [Lacipirellulaceae bacterium]
AGRRDPQSASVSHTAVALAPVLAAGPHEPRKIYDFAAAEARRVDDVEITDLGRNVKMPWEINGRKWHTQDRTSRSGAPVQWDGRILDEVEDRIQRLGAAHDLFAPTDWNSRTIVEVAAKKKADGWFFHAITGETWLLKLKFRTAKRTFDRDKLAEALALKPLNDLPEIEAYGHGPRVKCKNLRGPFQEVQIAAHGWDEVNTPAFWEFLDSAVAGFGKFIQRVQKSPEDVMPWKVLGRKWHLSRKGFPPGKKPAWSPETLEELLELLESAAKRVDPAGVQFLWNNQQVVHLMAPSRRTPWATVHTKRTTGVDLYLNGPAGAFAVGRIAGLAEKRAIESNGEGTDQVKLRFVQADDLTRGDLAAFLTEHLDAVRAAVV